MSDFSDIDSQAQRCLHDIDVVAGRYLHDGLGPTAIVYALATIAVKMACSDPETKAHIARMQAFLTALG